MLVVVELAVVVVVVVMLGVVVVVDDATGVTVSMGIIVDAIGRPSVEVGATDAGGDQKIVVTAVFAPVATRSSTGVLAEPTCTSLTTLIIGLEPAEGEPIWAETEMS